MTVGVLLVPAEPEGGDAQVRERQRSLRCLGLDLAADELIPDSLDLFAGT
jgi:hypothetical protein